MKPADGLLDLVVEVAAAFGPALPFLGRLDLARASGRCSVIGPMICTQAASRASTSSRAMRSASSRCAVVVSDLDVFGS